MCTLLTQCASQTASGWLLALSRLCLHSLARMGSQEGPCTFSGQRQCLSLGPTNVVVSCTNVGPVRRRAIDSSELRLTTDREGRQVGQHRSHIVAAVSSACLIARAAAAASRAAGSDRVEPLARPAGWADTARVQVGYGEGYHEVFARDVLGGCPPVDCRIVRRGSPIINLLFTPCTLKKRNMPLLSKIRRFIGASPRAISSPN